MHVCMYLCMYMCVCVLVCWVHSAHQNIPAYLELDYKVGVSFESHGLQLRLRGHAGDFKFNFADHQFQSAITLVVLRQLLFHLLDLKSYVHNEDLVSSKCVCVCVCVCLSTVGGGNALIKISTFVIHLPACARTYACMRLLMHLLTT